MEDEETILENGAVRNYEIFEEVGGDLVNLQGWDIFRIFYWFSAQASTLGVF